jgi:serine/threonine-protein kinase
MGAVYVGRHPLIDRKVAIKILRRELAADQALVERFINEARAANVIRHPNIVEILDVGTLADGLPYIVMELLAGESLAQRLERVGRLGVGQAIHFAVQATSALAAAHAQGIVHRDLKPDNLFLSPASPATAPAREVLKVLDFGIAKVRRDFSSSKLTSTGSLMGTPTYMSPEQCRGIPGEIDHRTDIYAMGAIVYQMLCGRPPFVSEGVGDLLIMHLSQAPAPVRSFNPNVPAHIEQAVLAALEKDKAARPQSMEDLQALLLSGELGDASTGEEAFAATMMPPDPASFVPGSNPFANLKRGAGTIPGSAATGGGTLAGQGGPSRQPTHPGVPGGPGAASRPATLAPTGLTKEPTTFSRTTGQVLAAAGMDGDALEALAASKRKRTMMMGGAGVGLVAVAAIAIVAVGGKGREPEAATGAPALAPAATTVPTAAATLPAASPAEAPRPATPPPAPEVAKEAEPPPAAAGPGEARDASAAASRSRKGRDRKGDRAPAKADNKVAAKSAAPAAPVAAKPAATPAADPPPVAPPGLKPATAAAAPVAPPGTAKKAKKW